jgi:transposase
MVRDGRFPAHRSLHGGKASKNRRTAQAKPVTTKAEAEQVVEIIRRATRKTQGAAEKTRIVLAGLRGEDSIAELCRREGIAQSLYCSWSKEFLEAGKKRLAGDTARQATSTEVKALRVGSLALKEVVADLTLENRILKKTRAGLGASANEIPGIREARDHPHRRAIPPSGPPDPDPDRDPAHDLLPLA